MLSYNYNLYENVYLSANAIKHYCNNSSNANVMQLETVNSTYMANVVMKNLQFITYKAYGKIMWNIVSSMIKLIIFQQNARSDLLFATFVHKSP